MSLDGNGTYSPPAPQFPAIPDTIVYADDFNQIILDIATALSTAIFRDGQAAFTADQSLGNNKLTNVKAGVNPQDAVNFLQVFTDPVFVATTLQGFKISGSMFQALMTTIKLVASGTLTLTGTTLLDASASGEVRLPANTSIGTVSASELATLDGLTASTAELNILDGALLTTAELNILAGALITTAELNRLTGVTSNVQGQLDEKAPLNSAALTGVPTAPTAPVGTNSNQIATMAALIAQAFSATLPAQAGNNGKVVSTDGSNAFWTALKTLNGQSLLGNGNLIVAPQVQAIASGSLSDGSKVIVNSDGTVTAVGLVVTPIDPPTAGSSAAFNNSGAPNFVESIYDAANGKVVIVFRDTGNANYGTAVVGTVSGSSISFGAEVVFNSAATSRISAAYDSVQGKLLVAFCDQGNLSYGTAIVGTVSGTSITFGSKYVFNAGTTDNDVTCAYNAAAQTVVIAYCDQSNSNYGTAIAGTIAGTVISFGAEYVFNSQTTYNIKATFNASSGKVVVVFCDYGTTRYGTALVVSCTGTVLSFGSNYVFRSAETLSSLRPVTLPSSAAVFTYTNSSNRVTSLVATISGTTLSFGSEYAINSSGYNTYVSVTYDEKTSRLVYAYSTNTTNYPGAARLASLEGNIITPLTELALAASSSYEKSVVYDATSEKIVVTENNNGFVLNTFNMVTNLTSENYIGISDAAYTDGQTATIQLVGTVDDAQSGLTPGQAYYIQRDGALGLSPDNPSVFAGTAVTATKLIVKG